MPRASSFHLVTRCLQGGWRSVLVCLQCNLTFLQGRLKGMLCSEWVEIWPLYCISKHEKKQPFLLRERVCSKSGSSWLCSRARPARKEHPAVSIGVDWDAPMQSVCPVVHSSLLQRPPVLLCVLGKAESTAEMKLWGRWTGTEKAKADQTWSV